MAREKRPWRAVVVVRVPKEKAVDPVGSETHAGYLVDSEGRPVYSLKKGRPIFLRSSRKPTAMPWFYATSAVKRVSPAKNGWHVVLDSGARLYVRQVDLGLS